MERHDHHDDGFARVTGPVHLWRIRRRAESMNEVTRILSAIEHGDPKAVEQLLPSVYDELRRPPGA